MSDLLNDISLKMFEIILPSKPFPLYNYTHLLNKTDWLKLHNFMVDYDIIDISNPHEKPFDKLKPNELLLASPSYIQPLRVVHDDTVCLIRSDIYLNHWWFINTNRDKYFELLISIAHELFHYVGYITDKRFIQIDEEYLLDEYVISFMEIYPIYTRKIKSLLKKRQPDKFDDIMREIRGPGDSEIKMLPTKVSVEKLLSEQRGLSWKG